MQPIKAWHFAASDNRLNYEDKREIVIGETHTISTETKELELCHWGLHASERIIDALQYAPGPMIYWVELSGQIILGDDKLVATERTYLSGLDGTDILKEFARICALDVIHLWDAPDIVVEYLKTGNEALRDAAWAAAWAAALAADSAAARAAAWAAARPAARDAAWTAASAAAWAAASAAAWYAAWDAAWAADWEAASAAARDAAWTAAGAADWEAARAAAWAAQNKRLAGLVNKAMTK